MTNKYQDDIYTSLDDDISRVSQKHRMYMSYSNEAGAKSVVDEILNNALDECRNPKSPGDTIKVIFDEESGMICIEDNGRGIPTDILEDVFTSLNMGSNIDSTKKSDLNAEILGMNGVGTTLTAGTAERAEITSNRGGTENKTRTIIFEEGKKVSDITKKCSDKEHGMRVIYKPSKEVLGKKTKIVWKDIVNELQNLQYLNNKKISITSIFIDKKGKEDIINYKQQSFDNILSRNDKEVEISPRIFLKISDNNVIEEINNDKIKRYIDIDVAFEWTSSLTPYMDSFSNSNNTVDGGDHFDGALEAICRFFQKATKNSLGEKEKQNLDIKWEDVKQGLSLAVALRTNFESLYTGQTKHKIVNNDIKNIIISLTTNALEHYFEKNTSQLKELCSIIKMNAKARREGDKIKNAVVKNTLTNWGSFKLKNYDPCANKGVNSYKELFIIEGD